MLLGIFKSWVVRRLEDKKRKKRPGHSAILQKDTASPLERVWQELLEKPLAVFNVRRVLCGSIPPGGGAGFPGAPLEEPQVVRHGGVLRREQVSVVPRGLQRVELLVPYQKKRPLVEPGAVEQGQHRVQVLRGPPRHLHRAQAAPLPVAPQRAVEDALPAVGVGTKVLREGDVLGKLAPHREGLPQRRPVGATPKVLQHAQQPQAVHEGGQVHRAVPRPQRSGESAAREAGVPRRGAAGKPDPAQELQGIAGGDAGPGVAAGARVRLAGQIVPALLVHEVHGLPGSAEKHGLLVVQQTPVVAFGVALGRGRQLPVRPQGRRPLKRPRTVARKLLRKILLRSRNRARGAHRHVFVEVVLVATMAPPGCLLAQQNFLIRREVRLAGAGPQPETIPPVPQVELPAHLFRVQLVLRTLLSLLSLLLLWVVRKKRGGRPRQVILHTGGWHRFKAEGDGGASPSPLSVESVALSVFGLPRSGALSCQRFKAEGDGGA
eukprot:CAMPEP_0197505486 /NCGR_PEP_ID=MMETSP1312-20131121/4219_1 /TAXON_ID=464262 /ORGANISM="Genus nov. species nov., Strain RCC2335" /LENGTH=490 /DNA_ID=CAMNT_0043052437 /DNA_START=126 /DNA_END=1595 /DNA_ORIENTATION=+